MSVLSFYLVFSGIALPVVSILSYLILKTIYDTGYWNGVRDTHQESYNLGYKDAMSDQKDLEK